MLYDRHKYGNNITAIPNIMRFIDDKIIISDEVPSSIMTLAEIKVSFTDVNITGNTSGRLIMVIMVLRMPVCTAMADVKLKMMENAKDDNDKTIRNNE